MKTFAVSESNNRLFENKMNKFIRKAEKLGIDFGYHLENVSDASYEIRDAFGEKMTIWYKVYHYQVWGESPTINGYSFLAKIEPFENGNLIHSHNSDYDFSEYRNAKLVCEHCHVNRYRGEYFLIQNDADQTVKMVGRNCLANYINLANAEKIAEFYSSLNEFSTTDYNHDTYDGTQPHNYIYSIEEFFANAIAVINKNGYVKGENENGEAGIISTKSRTISNFFSQEKYKIIPTDEQKQLAKTILAETKDLLNAKSDRNTYEQNVLQLIEAGQMKIWQHAGYIVSIYPLHDRLLNIMHEKKEKPVSNFIGTVGQKIENIKCTLVFYTYAGESRFPVHVYGFVDEAGNRITYFSSNSFDIERGDTINIIKCTVKDHQVYRGENQTVITRAKIEVLTKAGQS